MRVRTLLALSVMALALRAVLGLGPPIFTAVDPLLAVAIVAALPGSLGAALGAGLLTGLLEDAWTGGWFGEHAFTHTVVAYLIAWIAGRVDLTDAVPAVAALAVGSLLDWSLQLGLAMMFDRPVGSLPGAGAWTACIAGTTLCGLAVRGLQPRSAR